VEKTLDIRNAPGRSTEGRCKAKSSQPAPTGRFPYFQSKIDENIQTDCSSRNAAHGNIWMAHQ